MPPLPENMEIWDLGSFGLNNKSCNLLQSEKYGTLGFHWFWPQEQKFELNFELGNKNGHEFEILNEYLL